MLHEEGEAKWATKRLGRGAATTEGADLIARMVTEESRGIRVQNMVN